MLCGSSCISRSYNESYSLPWVSEGHRKSFSAKLVQGIRRSTSQLQIDCTVGAVFSFYSELLSMLGVSCIYWKTFISVKLSWLGFFLFVFSPFGDRFYFILSVSSFVLAKLQQSLHPCVSLRPLIWNRIPTLLQLNLGVETIPSFWPWAPPETMGQSD